MTTIEDVKALADDLLCAAAVDEVDSARQKFEDAIEQYAAERVAKARKPLPEEQIGQQAMQIYGMRDWTSMDIRFARAIERAHGIGEQQNG